MNRRAKGTSNTEKKIMMFKFKTDDDILTYCDQGYKYISKQKFTQIRSNPITEEYLLVNHNKLSNFTLQKQYKLFLLTADFLKELTNSDINLYKTGGISKTARQLWLNLCNPPKASKIANEEAVWIRSCRGQLKHSIPYKGQQSWKLDITSEYPFIMRSDHFQVPIKKGKFLTLTKEEFNTMKFYKYGIYRVKMISRVNPFIFRPNDKNYYTHTDLNFAKELGYEMDLIEDGKPNFLSYEGCLMNGAKLFRPFTDYLFNLKQMGYKTAKVYINRLWGALCKKNLMAIDTQKDNEIRENREIIQFCPTEDNLIRTGKDLKIDIANADSFFETGYARLKPFLLAKARYVTAQHVMKNIDDIVYINTDGYILKAEPHPSVQYVRLKDKKTAKMGDLILEAENQPCEVFHSNKVIGFENPLPDPFVELEMDKQLFLKNKQKK
jgi:hypothetical protein